MTLLQQANQKFIEINDDMEFDHGDIYAESDDYSGVLQNCELDPTAVVDILSSVKPSTSAGDVKDLLSSELSESSRFRSEMSTVVANLEETYLTSTLLAVPDGHNIVVNLTV